MKLIKYKNGKYCLRKGTSFGFYWYDPFLKYWRCSFDSKYQMSYDEAMKIYNTYKVDKVIKIPKYRIKIKRPKKYIFNSFVNWLFAGNF